MGSGNHVVVDVSSDEEAVDSHVDRDYSTWLNEVMEAVDDKSDSTDVVEVLSEVKGAVDSHYRKPNSSIHALDEDDDCVILDGDPDKTAGVDKDDKLPKNDDDDDDVLVVGQKGEIACRDFPHPRHSCAKYSFSSTSHEKYCDMCHCYVCDIRAPCPYWCIGVSSIDHCHANDKEKIWKNQREYFRTGNMPTHPSSDPTAPLAASATVTHLLPTQNIIRLSHSTLPRNQVGIRPCSSSSSVANLSNVRTRYRRTQSVPQKRSHGLQNRLVQSNVIQKNTSPYVVNPRFRVAASSRARYCATNGNNIRTGLYTNAQVSQSAHHTTTMVAPPTTIQPEIDPRQPPRNHQLNGIGYSTLVTVSQSNGYSIHPGQNKSGSGNCQFQANADLFALHETPLVTSADPQAHSVHQQPGGTNENVLQTKLSEFESWLMDNSNQTGSIGPLAGPIDEDDVSPLSFDFETFLND